MNKRNCILVVLSYIVSLLISTIITFLFWNKSETVIIESFDSANIDISGMEIYNSIIVFQKPTAEFKINCGKEQQLQDIVFTIKNIPDAKITCQIYYSDMPEGKRSGDLSSSITVLQNGKNVVKMPNDKYFDLWFTFRTNDIEDVNFNISSICFTDNTNYIAVFVKVFLILTIVFLLLFFSSCFKKEEKYKIENSLELWLFNNKKNVCVIISFIISLGLVIKPLIDNKISKPNNDSVRYFWSRIQTSMSEASPTVQVLIYISAFSMVFIIFDKLKKKINLPAMLISALFACFTMIGDSFYYYNNLDSIFTSDCSQILINAITFLSLFLSLYLICALLIELTENTYTTTIKFSSNKFVYQIQKIYENHPILILALIILLFWLPYIIIYYPGIIPSDTAKQIEMWFTGAEWKNNSPLFSTFLVCTSIEIGRLLGSDNFGVFIFSGTQTVILAFLLSYCINFLKNAGVPAVVYRIWLISILILPVYPCSAIQLGKDTNYTICVLILIIFLYKIIKEPDVFFSSWKQGIFLTASMIYMSLVRHNGIYVVVLSAGVVFLFLKDRKRFIKITACFLSTIIIYSGFNIFVPLIIDYNNSKNGIVVEEKMTCAPPTVFASVMHNAMGRIVFERGDELTDEQLEIINSVYYSADRLGEVYKPEISDYAAAQWRNDVNEERYTKFKELFFDLIIEYPDVFIESFFNKCYSYLYGNSASKEKGYVWVGVNTFLNSLDEVSIYNNDIYKANGMRFYGYMCAIMEVPVLSFLSYVGVYTWIIVFVIIVLLIKKEYKSLLIVIPVLASLAVCVMSPVNGYIRYALPIIWGAPILLSLCFGTNRKNTNSNR